MRKPYFSIFAEIDKSNLFSFSALEKSVIQTPNRIAFGFSLSSLSLLERLKAGEYVDQIFISSGSASSLEKKPLGLLESMPKDFLKDYWQINNKIIFIGSVGAVVRLIAPFVISKDNDPAVLVIDSKTNYIVSLLGGHKSGADQFAKELASVLGAEAIFTSDSHTEKRPVLDCFGEAWGWKRGGNISNWRKLMIGQSKNQKSMICQSSGSKLWQNLPAFSNYFLKEEDEISSHNFKLFIGPEAKNECSWHPPTIWVGIGCERNTDEQLIQRSIQQSFSKNGLSTFAIAGFATIDKKNNEVGLLNLLKKK